MSVHSINAKQESDADPSPETTAAILENVRQALLGLKFGEVTITVRDGNVVQIDRVARKRQFKS